MADNTLLPSAELVVALINRENSASLTTSLVSLGAPTVIATDKNTSVVVSAVQGSGYKGTQTVTYNRLDLDDIVTTAGLEAKFPLGDATTISQLISEFNTLYGVNLSTDDFVDGPLPEFTGALGEEHTFQLEAAVGSLAYIGEVTVTVVGNDIDLADVITITELDGLTYAAPGA